MKALVFEGDLRFESDYPRPDPQKSEALIRVLMAGICNTDLEIRRGYMEFRGIPGHEFVGRVVETAGQAREWADRRVVGEINCGCGICAECLENSSRHCQARDTLGIFRKDGCFAEYITLPTANLRAVPDQVRDEAAVFTEPLAAALQIKDQVQISSADRILVLGDGKLGLLIAMALNPLTRRLVLAGRHPQKLRIASDFGISNIPFSRLQSERYDIVIEATGRAEGFAAALALTRPRGTLVLKSTVAAPRTVDLTPIVVNEIQVIGSRCGRFAPALDLLSRGLDPTALISAVFPLEQGPEAFAAASRPTALKVLFDLRDSASS